MAPCGSSRKVRYQLRGFRLQDRTKTRPSTTTAQMPMKRCGAVPARMASILPSRMAARTSRSNSRLVMTLDRQPTAAREPHWGGANLELQLHGELDLALGGASGCSGVVGCPRGDGRGGRGP